MDVYMQYETIHQMLSEISSRNITYLLPSIKVNNGFKIEGLQDYISPGAPATN